MCISHLAEEHRMVEIMGSPGGQGESVACRERTQLRVSQHLECSGMTNALERRKTQTVACLVKAGTGCGVLAVTCLVCHIPRGQKYWLPCSVQS